MYLWPHHPFWAPTWVSICLLDIYTWMFYTYLTLNMFSHLIKLYHRLLRWANQNYNFHFCFFLSTHGIFCSYLSLYFSNIPTSLHLHSHHPIPSHCLPLPEPWQGPLTSLLTFSHIYIPTVTFLLKSLYCFLICCLIKHERLTSTSKTLWIQLLTTFWSSFQVLYSVFILLW